ncbi:putative ABC transporter permease [Massiliimalia massiliensis]|jgi:uncharacterized membrane protein|uniref:putative ABC transporter permease n=1 Tax=Massiliimalia massiliensis TaxID=1852384 RepID=UPI000984F80A|nr:hypothetical protein [Massiliimalia massiliensis]
MSNKTKEKMVVFSIGATAYTVIELLWRQHTHWSMSLAGGTCFSILYHIYNRWRVMPLARKCLIGSAVITGVEFIFGVVVNLWQKWNVWDYSNLKFNLLGQICPLYSGLWFLLSIPIVFISRKLKVQLNHLLHS